jgi:hypothetical protein
MLNSRLNNLTLNQLIELKERMIEMKMNEINISKETREIIKSKNINFQDFLIWFHENKLKINKEKWLTESEKNFYRYLNKPSDYVVNLIYLFRLYQFNQQRKKNSIKKRI